MIRNWVLPLFLCLSYCITGFSQSDVSLHIDIGSTNVAPDIFLKSAAMGRYRIGKNQFEAGFLLNSKATQGNAFGGYRLQASRKLAINNRPLNIQFFWLQTIHSDLLRETNWGTSIRKQAKHLDIMVGTEFRTYAFRNYAIEKYGIVEEATKLHEDFNVIYSLSYNLKSPGSYWNVGLSVTNLDYFMVNQETNPLFCLRGSYKLKAPISLLTQFWYEPAGVFNIYANYFGSFIRTGILWNLGRN